MPNNVDDLGQTILKATPTRLSLDTVAPRLFVPTSAADRRFWEFFTAVIRNPNTRRAYFHAVSLFSAWCEGRELGLGQVSPIHVAAYIEELGQAYSRPSVKQHLAALRMLFDWLVTGAILQGNPASSVRGPKYSVRRGKTPALLSEEMKQLLTSIDTSTLKGLRDRALIALMGYTFARVGAALTLKVEDYYIQGRRGWIRLREKAARSMRCPATIPSSNIWRSGLLLRVSPRILLLPCFPPFEAVR